jgi:hypothetical protein
VIVPDVSFATRVRNGLRALGIVADPGAWIDPAGRVLLCAYPRGHRALRALQARGISLMVNLHRRPHLPSRLVQYQLKECHVPVPDFHAPALPQLATVVATMVAAVDAGARLAIHCGGGLGRSGTAAACYLVELGLDWRAAVAAVRTARPGAIETGAQVAAVASYAGRRGPPRAGDAFAPGHPLPGTHRE